MQDVENNAGDGDFIFKKEVSLLASEALLERMKRQGAFIAPSQNLRIENGFTSKFRSGAGYLGKTGGDDLQVAGENLRALRVGVDLGANAVELRLDPERGGIGKSGLNGGGIRFGRGQHALDRLEKSHCALVEAAISCHDCHETQVAAEHVCLAHLAGIGFEGIGDTFLQQALFETDAQVAGEDLDEKLGGDGRRFSEKTG